MDVITIITDFFGQWIPNFAGNFQTYLLLALVVILGIKVIRGE